MQAGGHMFKQKVWEAIIGGSVQALEGVIWEIITAEVHSGRCCFRKALLLALDGSDLASEAQRNELLQRFAAQSGAGDTDAQCFIGILLCFQGGHDGNEFVMPAHGVKFLHAAAERHNNLATLLLALCFECGKGVEVSTDAAKQCYNMAASRGYQMAQIFLKELVRDTTFASQQAAQQQQAALAQMQSSLQAANLGLLGQLNAHGAGQQPPPGGLHAAQLAAAAQQQQQAQLAQQLQLSQQLNAGGGALGGLNLAQLGQLGQPDARQELLELQASREQQVAGARKRLQAAVQDRDAQALASAADWAQEVSGSTGLLSQELAEARSILTFCRERGRFPELPGMPGAQQQQRRQQQQQLQQLTPRSPSPAPFQRSVGPAPDARPAAAQDGKAGGAGGGARAGGSPPKSEATLPQPTAAEKGEAFFQQGDGSASEVPLEPLEQAVTRTPSEQLPPPDASPDDSSLEGAPASADGTPRAAALPEQPPEPAQQPSPAVAIPPKRGSSSHGSIGDRRPLSSSVAEGEPPLTKQALEQLNRAHAAGTRSAPASHKDPLEQMSVASLASLQPRKEGEAAGEPGNPLEPLPAAPAGPPKAPPAQGLPGINAAALRLGKDGRLPPLDQLVTPEGLDVLAGQGVPLDTLSATLASTTDPAKLEEYVRSICQILEAADPRPAPGAPAPAPERPPSGLGNSAAAGQQQPPPPPQGPPAPAASGPPEAPREDWGKLMQALQANLTGLEGEPLADYLHNLRTLCREDPTNDMVTPPAQPGPGMDAILGALQGASQQQQAAVLRAAAAARPQAQQARAQPGLGQQASQMLPPHLQGLGGGGLGQAGGFGQPHGLAGNPLAYSQAGLAQAQAQRRLPQPLGGGLDMAHLLDPSRQLPNGMLQARPQLGAARPSALGRQPGLGYNQLWGAGGYAGKPGMGGAHPGLLGASGGLKPAPLSGQLGGYGGGQLPGQQLPGQLSSGLLGGQLGGGNMAGSRYPGLPTKPLPHDLQRAMLGQAPLGGAVSGGNMGTGLGGNAGAWGASFSQGLGPGLGQPNTLGGLASQPLPSGLLGGMQQQQQQQQQRLQGYDSNGGLQAAGAGAQQHQQAASLQALQGARLDASQPLPALASMGGPQPPKQDAGAYSLFKSAAASQAPNPAAGGQSVQGLESLWGGGGGGLAAPLRAPSPFAPAAAGSGPPSPAHAGQASLADKLGDYGREAEAQAKVRSWASTGMLSAQPPPQPQQLGSAHGASSASLASWTSAEGLQPKAPARAPFYAGLGGDDSLAHAFRQRPPRAAPPAGGGGQLLGARSGLLGQQGSNEGLGLTHGAGLGSAPSNGGMDLGALGSGLGGLQTSAAFSSLGGGGPGPIGRTSSALGQAQQQPAPGRFPGPGF